MSFDKPFEAIEETDLASLIVERRPEGKTIEYKQALPANTHDDRKEFLADISSFANAVGGYIIFGMISVEGMPAELRGLGNVNPDVEVLRLANLAQASIEPRIPGILFRAIHLQQGGFAIIAKIPHSWAQPHVVSFERHWRFYSRNSAGKYPLDIDEVRAAFALSETVTERIRLFRADRLSKMVAGETPVRLEEIAKTVLHIVPFGAFDPRTRVDLTTFGEDVWGFTSLDMTRPTGYRFNLDGLLSYVEHKDGLAWSYVQVFRNACIEVVDTQLLPRPQDPPIIYSEHFEENLLRAIPAYLSIQHRLGIEPPLFLSLSLLGVRGDYLQPGFTRDPFWRDRARPIDRDSLLLPETVIEVLGEDPADFMRPIFDMLWNAAGWPRSGNYDEAGRWKGEERIHRQG